MCSLRVTMMLTALLAFFPAALHAQDARPYVLLSFDEKGRLEEANAWTALKTDMQAGKPRHVFILAHGWRTSKDRADETFTALAKLLREQQSKDDTIAVIGIGWPSLIGETESPTDQAFKRLAKAMAGSIAKSPTAKEQRAKLKEFMKKPATRLLLGSALELPDDEQLDAMIDRVKEPQNVETILSAFSYYAMKRRADLIGTSGLATCLSELQQTVPQARVHLVVHSFGCKVCLACLACESRAGKTVDSVTLLQAAVSQLSFAPAIQELEGKPAGAYAAVPKCVKGPIAVTHTVNDKALLAYAVASHMAAQAGELPGRKHLSNYEMYAALGSNGVVQVADVPTIKMAKAGTEYKLRAGLNSVNADNIIQSHSDIRSAEVAWLIWCAARHRL